jgi:hypothetical protein
MEVRLKYRRLDCSRRGTSTRTTASAVRCSKTFCQLYHFEQQSGKDSSRLAVGSCLTCGHRPLSGLKKVWISVARRLELPIATLWLVPVLVLVPSAIIGDAGCDLRLWTISPRFGWPRWVQGGRASEAACRKIYL